MLRCSNEREKINRTQLNKHTKNELIDILLDQQESFEKQFDEMNRNFELLLEQIKISKQAKFGRGSEKLELPEQLAMCFNEAEVTIENKYVVEPVLEQVIPEHKLRVKPKGKRDEDLSGFPVRMEEHVLSDEKLSKLFPGGYKRLPDEVYKKLEFHPATFEVVEHHVAVYGGKGDQPIVRADRPSELLKNSIVTASLAAAIINTKYINSVPLYRLEQEFKRYDVNISRQVMANWVIRTSERFISLLYDRMHEKLLEAEIIHADETPVKVQKDGRESMTNSYMWVYRTGRFTDSPPAILYEYQKTRSSDHPEKFLESYKGTVVCDGYQSYHKVADKRPDELIVAGCWTHARRKFANVCKALGKEKSIGSLAAVAVSQIASIYHTDNSLAELMPAERLKKRQELVRPMVDNFFAWIKSNRDQVPSQSETGKGFNYCINQEKYLRTFLENPLVPLDNNDAEIAIRGFCVGRNNWHVIDTIEGAKASAILYSIAETAKANELKPYDYFKHILEEIPKHMDDKSLDFLDTLLPWSESLPENIKKKDKKSGPQ